MEELGKQTKIWHMPNTCWIPKATNTHSEYVKIYCFSTATMVARKRLNITLQYVQYKRTESDRNILLPQNV